MLASGTTTTENLKDTVDTVPIDFNNASDGLSYNIIVNKLLRYGPQDNAIQGI